MEFLYSLSVGIVVAAGIYMMLERHVVRVILGIALIAAAANMLIFLAGGVGSIVPPVVPYGEGTLSPAAANPLPQALVLTAIVIGFALVSFAIVLAFRAYRILGTLDTDEMTVAENEGTPFGTRPEPGEEARP
jgi:multicomponent Na+:H+ antiporter subunit C